MTIIKAITKAITAALWLVAVGTGMLALPTPVAAGHPHHGRPGHVGCADCQPGHGGHGHCGHGCHRGCQHCNYCGKGLLNHGGHGLDGHWIHHDTIEKRYFLRSQGKSWHSAWYDPSEGRPIALVVPPTAEFMTQYSWGVPSSRVMPLYHQFRRPYPGPGAVAGGGGGFMPTPNQPSDTVQFGVNAVRGPWNGY
jgi:hypothetical protein